MSPVFPWGDSEPLPRWPGRPEFFAAAIPICGGGDPTKVGQMRKTPFRVYHGGADRVIPASASKVMVDALKKAGGDVEMKVYEGVKHDSWSQTYRDPGVWKVAFRAKAEVTGTLDSFDQSLIPRKGWGSLRAHCHA